MKGRRVSLGRLDVVFVVTGEETGGALAVVEHPIQSGILVPPHWHERENELSYVIEGEVGAPVGEQERALAAGEYLWKPRGVPHAFWNASGAPARSSTSSSRPASSAFATAREGCSYPQLGTVGS